MILSEKEKNKNNYLGNDENFQIKNFINFYNKEKGHSYNLKNERNSKNILNNSSDIDKIFSTDCFSENYKNKKVGKKINKKNFIEKIYTNYFLLSNIEDFIENFIPIKLKKKFNNFKKENLKEIFEEISFAKNYNFLCVSNDKNKINLNKEKYILNKFCLLGNFINEKDFKIFQVYFRKLKEYDNIVSFFLYSKIKKNL